MGVKVANLVEQRGDLVGALVTYDHDEVLVIMEGGKIVRTSVGEVNRTGRNTQGVTFAKPDAGDRIIAITLNKECASTDEEDSDDNETAGGDDPVANDGTLGEES